MKSWRKTDFFQRGIISKKEIKLKKKNKYKEGDLFTIYEVVVWNELFEGFWNEKKFVCLN